MFKLKTYNEKKIYKKYFIKFLLWELISCLYFNTSLPGSFLRYLLLKMFGAKLGRNLILKPNIKIKYPWNLEIGDDCWIGEKVWIDNIANVSIGNNTCISQAVYICSASHNYNSLNFDLILAPVKIGNNCWVSAKSIIGPNAEVKDNTFIKMGENFFSKS